MRVSVIQPSYLPWCGFFEMIAATDLYVAFDHVKFEPSSWHQRNRILGSNGPFFLTVPVHRPTGGRDRICEVRINHGEPWVRKHLLSLEAAYKKSPHFEKVYSRIRRILSERHEFLCAQNLALIGALLDLLGIETPVVCSSNLELREDSGLEKNERLIRLLRRVGATVFYEGASGANFVRPELFEARGIQVFFQAYEHPVYQQRGKGFVPYMSVVDLLCNMGEDALATIRRGVIPTSTSLEEGR